MEPLVSYSLDIIREEQVTVGVITRPDETDRNYVVPLTFEKTITYSREIDVQGFVHIGGEKVYATALYTASLEPLETLISKLKRLGTGVGTFYATEKQYPIILCDSSDISLRSSSRSIGGMTKYNYYSAPLDWFNLSTEEGKAFFEEETNIYRIVDQDERMSKLFDARRMDEMDRFRFAPVETQTTIYTSEKSSEENIQFMVDFLSDRGQRFAEDDIREILYERS